MKNYIVQFMNGEYKRVTAQDALALSREIQKGAQMVMIAGGLKAVHQIISIDRVDRETERDLCDIAGIPLQDAPTIEKLMAQPETKKLTM